MSRRPNDKPVGSMSWVFDTDREIWVRDDLADEAPSKVWARGNRSWWARKFQQSYLMEARIRSRSAYEGNQDWLKYGSMLQNTEPGISRGIGLPASRLRLDIRIRFRTLPSLQSQPHLPMLYSQWTQTPVRLVSLG